MDNEVVIHVRVKNEGKAGFEAVQKSSDESAQKVSESYSEKLSVGIREKLGRKLTAVLGAIGGPGDTAGNALGDRIGERVSARVSERLTKDVNGRWRDVLTGRFASGPDGGRGGAGGDANVDVKVDVDKQSLWSRFADWGRQAADRFTGGFGESVKTGLTGVLSGDLISTIIKGLAIGGVVAAVAPVIGAAITAGILLALGGGALAAGVAAALSDPLVQAAASETGESLKKSFQVFGEPFQRPVLDFMVRLASFADRLSPKLKTLGESFAPILEKFGDKFFEALDALGPGVTKALEASKPLLDTLAEHLPKIADAISDFLTSISEQGDDANLFFGDLLTLVEGLIRFLGDVIAKLTSAYSKIHNFVAGTIEFIGAVKKFGLEASIYISEVFITVLGAIQDALGGIIPGLDGRLNKAKEKLNNFQRSANNELKKIRDREIVIKVRTVVEDTLGIVADFGKTLKKNAAGGITGAATGGLHGGLRMVGEHGRELLQLPSSTRVNSNPDTERILSGAGGGMQRIEVPVYLDGREIARAIVEPTRDLVRSLGSGSVQRYLGQPGVA